ncbi:hypothetical protein SCP_0309510 [Sparassis crispa]|uniref:Rho-GAP domain-containing protein n=1 Tax=Sparassis crispa TaxID=139825 RepID=A0A401GGB0_9APHY|nr:hypothetical protein SCP_0309510 [Sparassis crispa]GBE81224.1 hypothetical protein SCP_0309510 [Sparassis crispa]
MYSRNKDTHARNVAVSQSTSSLSSSLSSSVESSTLFPAATPSNSSQSDIATSDRSVASLTTSKSRFFPLSIAPRSTTTMGQATSQVPQSVPASPTSASSAGNKFKRAFAGRRKKSQDITAFLADTEGPTRSGKEREPTDTSSVVSPPSVSDHSHRTVDSTSRHCKDLSVNIAPTKFSVFGKKVGQSPKSPKFSGSPPLASPPPPLPPKSVTLPAQNKAALASVSGDSHSTEHPLPPPPSPPKLFLQVTAERLKTALPATPSDGASKTEGPVVAKEKPAQEREGDSHKEDWRKSDSTMASHYTVRPGALAGNRSPRPVSLAESSHSGNTIVPVNKRFSAIITDAEFSMVEESEGSEHDEDILSHLSISERASPNGSMKARNRRSVSLNFGPISPTKSKPSVAEPSSRPLPNTPTHAPGRFASDPLPAHDAPTLTRAAATGIIAPTNSSSTTHTTTGFHIRSRLAAWTSASLAPSYPAQNESAPPSSFAQPRRPSATPSGQPFFRQTAVSMTGSLAPTAGIAKGLGKRAVEKVGRVWGGFSSGASTASGYSSSSSMGRSDTSLRPTPSLESNATQPSMSEKRKFRRRTGHAFSGAASISSTSSSISDADHFVPTSPSLGTRLRGSRLSSAGAPVAGGLVFRRDLKECVRETAIDAVRLSMLKDSDDVDSGIRPLEERWLPALAVRCAQHLLKWGVQEEGLFRVSGRSSHVAKLRSEFDVGGDYDMAICDPGDLDPHAVASIFKTYLRELPDSILTSALIPYFESAMVAEEQARTSIDSETSRVAGKVGPSLSSGPQGGLPALRKPPSLSTLAMPSFATKRNVSESLLNALTWLIAQLPRENRDLLYTVVQLIKATADHSKETKMPMGNLLLVFCPSLNMNPNLLRVLCEADCIWNGVPKPPVENVISKVPEESENEEVEGTPSINASVISSSSMTSGEVSSSGEPTTEDEAWTLDTPEGSFKAPADDILEVAVSEPDQKSEQPITRISAMSVMKDDDASYVSAQEILSAVPTRSPSPAVSGPHIPPLLTSSDSSSSSSTNYEDPVSPQLPSSEDAAVTVIPSSEDSASAAMNSSRSSDPLRPFVPFPSSGRESPARTMTHRKSFTLLSFPQIRTASTESSAPSASSSTWPARTKRPSLHLLFSKSVSRLVSPTSGPPLTAASVPTLALTTEYGETSRAAFPSSSLSPPVLDTSISSSPIYLEFDDLVSHVRSNKEEDVSKPSGEAAESQQQLLHTHVRADSYAPSVYTTPMGMTPRETPIADFYQNRSKSLISFHGEEHVSPVTRARSESAVSQIIATPSIQIGVEAPEDWAQSVLLAARGESSAGKGSEEVVA